MKRPKDDFNKASAALKVSTTLRYIGEDSLHWMSTAVRGMGDALLHQPLIAFIAPAAVVLSAPVGFIMGVSSGIRRAIEEDWEALPAKREAIATDNLIKAVENGDLKAVQAAISSGANVDAKMYSLSSNNVPAIIHAAQHSQSAIVDSLIAAGADVDVRDLDGATAAMWAASWSGESKFVKGGNPILRSLIAAGADLSLKNNLGDDALRWARHRRNEENVKLIEQTVKGPGSINPAAGRAKAKALDSFKP